MGCFNDDIVADLQCRFSEGETPTWEEFYDWIEDIMDGFNAHAHGGTLSGDGPKIALTSIDGITEYEDVRDNTGASAIVAAVAANTGLAARVAAIEADYLVAADLDPYATIALLDSHKATIGGTHGVSGVGNYIAGTLAVAALDTRITDIELDYVVEADLDDYYTVAEINSILIDLEGWVEFNYDPTVMLCAAINADYVVAADLNSYALTSYVDSNLGDLEDELDSHKLAVGGTHGVVGVGNVIAGTDDLDVLQLDIDGIDDRVADIEADYVVAADLAPFWTQSEDEATMQDFEDWAKARWD